MSAVVLSLSSIGIGSDELNFTEIFVIYYLGYNIFINSFLLNTA